jgi:DNA-binding response OmpR family regulator
MALHRDGTTRATMSAMCQPVSAHKILVVDDESNAREALAELLRDEGFAVDTAVQGVDALSKVATFEPRVVITDLDMPYMDGIQLITELQKLSGPPPVIVLSSYGETARAMLALRAGASDYLSKPLRFDKLLVALADVIRLQHAG